MKRRINHSLILLIILAIGFSCKPEPNVLELSKFLIDSIQSQAIPDSRIEVFSIKASYFGDGILLSGKTTNSNAVARLEDQLKLQKVEFTDSIVRLPDPALGSKSWGLVTLSVANLRYLPAHSAEMATQALMGTPVKILQLENGWLLVQTPDRYIAWTDSAAIAPMTQSELEKWKSAERLIFMGDNGWVVNTPDKNGLPLTDMVMGGILAFDRKEKIRNPYIPVILPDGRKGFVNGADYMDFGEWSKQVVTDSSGLLKCAFNQLGRPYLWGGTSVKGFDCSGFTKSVYLKGGLILARDASQQVLQGVEVSKEAIWNGLKAGDLLFFGRTASEQLPEKVTHVGIYVGGSEFIHSSGSSGMVRVNSLDSVRANFKSYYRTNILHVRRLIDASNQPASFKTHPWYN